MRLACKLFWLSAAICAAVALSASTASAQLEIHNEDHPEDPCGTLHVVETHSVVGGCHFELESTEHIPLYAYIPAKTNLTNCNLHIEAQLGEDGSGYVTEAQFTNEAIPPVPGCTRQACDESEAATEAHQELLWPLQIEESAGLETVEVTLCLRSGSPPPEPPGNEGNAQTSCTVHMPISILGGHNAEAGTKTSPEPYTEDEVFCEPGLPFPVSIEPHLVNENPSSVSEEDAELIH